MLRSEKPKEVEKMKNLIDSYSVIGVLNLHKMPNKQLQKIKQKLKGKAEIKVAKKVIINKAIEGSNKKDIKQLSEQVKEEPALILSNENPFKLFAQLKKNEIPVAAKAGDIAPEDIVVKEGPTGIPPGPAISSLAKLKLKTTVKEGSIFVQGDTVAVKKGETINEDQAGGFNLLKMEPMKIRLSIVSAYEDGLLYSTDVLDIDQDEYQTNVEQCIANAFNLSVNASIPTKDNAELLLQKSFNEAKNLVIEANIIEKDFIDDVLAKAAREATALEGSVDIKVEETSEEKPAEESTEEKKEEAPVDEKKEETEEKPAEEKTDDNQKEGDKK